jgi:hypothetical protein
MKIGGNYPDARAPAGAIARRRVEKPHEAKGLPAEARAQTMPRFGGFERRARARESRIETGLASNAGTNGMPSGFIAQVLGQILAPPVSDRVMAERAYARSKRACRQARLVRVL